MGYCEVVPSIYVAVALLQSKPQDENICAVLEWVEPNEGIQARGLCGSLWSPISDAWTE